MRDLASTETNVRLRATQLMREAAYPEAAVPLAALVNDPVDAVQIEAIGAELNIFLAAKAPSRRRFAETVFDAGPIALGLNPVPPEVLTALRKAMQDSSPEVSIEAAFAFGALAIDLGGNGRRQLLLGSGPELTALIAAEQPDVRLAGIRVIGRLFGRRYDDGPVNDSVGDAVVVALNDPNRFVRAAAMETLGRIRFERAVQALTDLYQYYGRGETADQGLAALAQIGHRSSLNFMTAALTTRFAATRRIALEGLARIGDRSHTATVQATLSSERDDAVLLAGSFAFARLANGKLDDFVAALTEPRRREQAFNYLIELAPGRTAEFGPLALNPSPAVRADIADILGLAADPAALPIVEAMTRERDPEVAAAAERAAARLRAASRRPS